jgi:hypothetical protein
MKEIAVLLMTMLISSYANLEPRTVSSNNFDTQGKLIFKAAVTQTVVATKKAFSEKGWKILYEGSEPPKKDYAYFSNREPFSGKSYDRIAWDKSLSSTMAPKHFITGKTPTSAFSFGAELFITVFESPNSGSVVSISASTSQVLEKDKLELYINQYTDLLNQKID